MHAPRASSETAVERPGDVKWQFRRPDRLVAELAGRQHGVVSRRQLLSLGLGREAIYGRIANGRLHRLHAGVYAVGHRVVSKEGRWMAAVLAGGLEVVLSHRSAAVLWGLLTARYERVEVTSPRSARSRGWIERHHAGLCADEITRRRGIPVTTVSRTLLDLAAVVPADALERAMRESEVLRLPHRPPLNVLLARHPGRRGSRALETCLRRLERLPAGVTRSSLEDVFVLFLDQAGLPQPQRNVRLRVSNRTIEADCLWPEQRLIVELDGHAAHGTRAAFESDRERDRYLQSAGWRVVRITWRQLHDESAATAVDLRRLLETGSPGLAPTT